MSRGSGDAGGPPGGGLAERPAGERTWRSGPGSPRPGGAAVFRRVTRRGLRTPPQRGTARVRALERAELPHAPGGTPLRPGSSRHTGPPRTRKPAPVPVSAPPRLRPGPPRARPRAPPTLDTYRPGPAGRPGGVRSPRPPERAPARPPNDEDRPAP
ncbi:hypothetical protein SSBG_05359 [Streptomyces sp. SPB074]|nr:hypothetical protein SSBG_05359 [Streptomyces sp. SPB074]